MSHPGGWFRRPRAGEQGRSLPPPAPPASLSLSRKKRGPSRPRNPLTKQARKIPVELAAKTARLTHWRSLTLVLLVVGYAGYYLCRSNLSVASPLILRELEAGGTRAAAA